MSRIMGCCDRLYLLYFLFISYDGARIVPGQEKKHPKFLFAFLPAEGKSTK